MPKYPTMEDRWAAEALQGPIMTVEEDDPFLESDDDLGLEDDSDDDEPAGPSSEQDDNEDDSNG